MNNKRFFHKFAAVSTILFSLIISGCQTNASGNNNQPSEIPVQGEPGKDGVDGQDGKDGATIFNGETAPGNIGEVGDYYLNTTTWDFYQKNESGWQLIGNIKGSQGETGVSITSTEIDDNGDLIITLSNGQTLNAGHVKDVTEHIVKFYCEGVLVDTQSVKHGEKVTPPELEDIVINHWYIDEELTHEWLWYGCVVTEDMSLYARDESVIYSLSFDNALAISVDGYGFGSRVLSEKEVCVSKAQTTTSYFTVLEDRGIVFNKSQIGYITEVDVDIDSSGFEHAKIYYGKTPLSFDNSEDLSSGNNVIDLSKSLYFTIQNTGTNPININSLTIKYKNKSKIVSNELPVVEINTSESQPVTSQTDYVDCEVSTHGAVKDVTNLVGEIRIRGNSTATCPKKPYRIKLDKKNSLFGYEKAKNWVLLAEYMDGSNMHNYTALKFAEMVRNGKTFGVNPLHVNVILNGTDIGLYTFGEHIDAKEGRLDIEQKKIWEKSFDDINFYIERDWSTRGDANEIEGETYFMVDNISGYSPAQYAFALKYPEKEDFVEELDDGTIVPHEEEFQAFFNNLKNYITDVCNRFATYHKNINTSNFASVAAVADMPSLAEFAVIDQALRESDHYYKSYKMYRVNGGKLQFGPNWDYDSCAFGLPYQGTYILNPFTVGSTAYDETHFGDTWGYALYRDTENGRPLFKNIWNKLSSEQINQFIYLQIVEMRTISARSVYDCELWMHNQYYSLFDNIIFHWKYLTNRFSTLKTLYS